MPNREEALQQVPLFAELSARHLRRLAKKLRERQFEPGTDVVREGEMSGIGFFIVVSGEATVTCNGQTIATLAAGDQFGELALIAERERTATVTAETALHCLELPSWDFRDLVQADGDLAWRLLQHVVSVLLENRPDATPAPSAIGDASAA
jgi:CRP-like cAMP-binding protein